MPRYRARHRKQSTTGRTIARTALVGAVVGAPLAVAVPANAATDSVWDKVAQCESTGNWSINNGNGFSGGLQFTAQTWRAFGGGEFAPAAYQASRAEQIVVAERVLAGQGWGAWPVCSRKAGAVGQPATQRSAPSAPVVAAKPPKPAKPAKPAVEPVAPAQVRLSEAVAAAAGSYVVKAGDTLSGIAAAHGIDGGWQALVAKNAALAANPNLILPGQRIAF